MTRYGFVKSVGGKFGEIDGGNQFVIERPGGGHHIDPEKALANNLGYVYAAVNAKAREMQNIDFRLFSVKGDDHDEKEDHPLLDLLDGVNPDMIGAELKYLTSSHLDLVGNCYWLLTDSRAKEIIYRAFIEDELDAPKHLARVIHRDYFEPAYPEFAPRTKWNLQNAFTSGFKLLQPIPQFKATESFGEFFNSLN
jgi:hypothetical protein